MILSEMKEMEMERKLNCWEFMKCGCEPGGFNVEKFGVCKTTTDISCDGINDGVNGGRICWAISGTYCLEKVDGAFAREIANCRMCEFFQLVFQEEGKSIFSLRKKE